MSLDGKLVLITGSARRVGRELALDVAKAGANLVIHYHNSKDEAESLSKEIESLGRKAYLLQADFTQPDQISGLISRTREFGPLYALVNSASNFELITWEQTTMENFNRHLMVNAITPFLLSQAFARHLTENENGRIVNMLDWRALRPGVDHFPYTIAKATLVAITEALALSFAPRITVNGLALGAILPPEDGSTPKSILKDVPAGRWAKLEEVSQALIFLLDGPSYITGEIIYVDGGRHLV